VYEELHVGNGDCVRRMGYHDAIDSVLCVFVCTFTGKYERIVESYCVVCRGRLLHFSWKLIISVKSCTVTINEQHFA
jgi:hypothetical protein